MALPSDKTVRHCLIHGHAASDGDRIIHVRFMGESTDFPHSASTPSRAGLSASQPVKSTAVAPSLPPLSQNLWTRPGWPQHQQKEALSKTPPAPPFAFSSAPSFSLLLTTSSLTSFSLQTSRLSPLPDRRLLDAIPLPLSAARARPHLVAIESLRPATHTTHFLYHFSF